MALDLYMLGLVVANMGASLEFYRRLGLAIPEGSEGKSHVEVRMGNRLTFFLDSRPERWDPHFAGLAASAAPSLGAYRAVLEFYLRSQAEVDARYAELVGYGYASHAAPRQTEFGMYFGFVNNPDGNTILLSADAT